MEQVEAVNGVLAELGCAGRPTLLVLTRAEAVTDCSVPDVLLARHPGAVVVSSRTGEGLDALEAAVRAPLAPDVDGKAA